MPVRPVVRLPQPVLKRVARPVGRVGDGELALAEDLVDTMRSSPACVGLAANQIGDERRAFCVDVTGHRKAESCHGLLVLFDPVLVEARAPATAREGCLSVPDLTGNVVRATEVVMQGLTTEGESQQIEADAFEARALLHELDHLDGLLFLDRIDSFAADVFKRHRYR